MPSLKCFGRCLEPHHKDTFEAGVRSHSVEPWAQRRAFLDAVAIPPGKKQRLLHRVLGVRQGAEHAVTVDKQFAAMTLDIATELVWLCGAGQGCRGRILERLYIDNCLPLTVELFRQLAFFILSCKPISYCRSKRIDVYIL